MRLEGPDRQYDFTFLGDATECVVQSLAHLKSGGKSFRCNVSTGRGTTILELANLVDRILGKTTSRVVLPERPFDPREFVGSNRLCKAILGYSPSTSLEQGLRMMLAESPSESTSIAFNPTIAESRGRAR